MERKYVCIDCGKEFIVESRRATHAKRCPVLGIKLNLKIPNRGDRGDNLRNYDSPSLDKIIPSLGYAKGNIWVISYRANTIKNNCTFEEIQKLYEALLKLEVNS